MIDKTVALPGPDCPATESTAAETRKAILTAPERIWLQISDDALCLDSDEFPSDHEHVTWCDTPVVGQEVEYIRADIPDAERVDVELVRAVIAEMREPFPDNGAPVTHSDYISNIYGWADELAAAIGDKT